MPKLAITASEARRNLFPLIEQVNNDRTPAEINCRRGDAVLISRDDYRRWRRPHTCCDTRPTRVDCWRASPKPAVASATSTRYRVEARLYVARMGRLPTLDHH